MKKAMIIDILLISGIKSFNIQILIIVAGKSPPQKI